MSKLNKYFSFIAFTLITAVIGLWGASHLNAAQVGPVSQETIAKGGHHGGGHHGGHGHHGHHGHHGGHHGHGHHGYHGHHHHGHHDGGWGWGGGYGGTGWGGNSGYYNPNYYYNTGRSGVIYQPTTPTEVIVPPTVTVPVPVR